jgi:hypothetical protein
MTFAATLRNSTAIEKESHDQMSVVEQTLLFWQRRTSKNFSAEEAREMVESVAGFFSQLAAWEADYRAAATAVPLKNPNVTEISAGAQEPTNEPELTQESVNCSPASNFLAA